MKKFTVKTLVTVALLISISIVLARLLVIYITPSVRINFGNIPIMLAGLLYGPIIGGAAGAIADILGTLFLSGMGWYPPLTVSAAIMGIVPGLLAFLVKKNPSIPKMAVIVFTSNLFGTMLWTTYWLTKLNNVSFGTLAAVRIPLYLCMTVVETLALYTIYKAVSGTLRKSGD